MAMLLLLLLPPPLLLLLLKLLVPLVPLALPLRKRATS